MFWNVSSKMPSAQPVCALREGNWRTREFDCPGCDTAHRRCSGSGRSSLAEAEADGGRCGDGRQLKAQLREGAQSSVRLRRQQAVGSGVVARVAGIDGEAVTLHG